MGFGDWWNSTWNAASGKAKQAASAVANGYDATKEWTAEKAGQAKDWAVEKSTQAKDWAVEKGTQAKDYTVQKATQAKDYAVEKATQAKDYTVQKATQAKDYAVEKATQAKDYTVQKATQAKDYTVQKYGEAKEWAAEKGTSIARSVEKGGMQAGENLGGWLDRAGNAVRNAKDSAAAKAKSAYNTARGWFGLEPVGDACPTCPGPKEPTTDAEADGWYMGEGCKPKKTLAEAKNAPVTPDKNNKCCEGKSGQKTIYYVNGIQTERADHCDTLKEIANSTCANVIGIYNATGGKTKLGFVKDAMQTGADRQLINKAAGGEPPTLDGRNPAVNTVSDTIYEEMKHNNGNKPEIWAHSQGGAVTSLGLYSANSRLQMAGKKEGVAGANVTSFGSAAPQWVDGPEYDHWVHANDITPVSLGLGDNGKTAAERGGKGATITRFSGNAANGFPNEGSPGFEKGFLTPTSNHDVAKTYIAKRDAEKGGCGASHKAAQPAAK